MRVVLDMSFMKGDWGWGSIFVSKVGDRYPSIIIDMPKDEIEEIYFDTNNNPTKTKTYFISLSGTPYLVINYIKRIMND